MHTFFHGWRRKAGVVALVMALAWSLLWYRSTFFGDRLVVGDLVVVSQAGGLSLGQKAGVSRLALQSHALNAESSGTFPGGGTWHSSSFKWNRIGPVIPYWPFAIPLTLLSTYLLLWKPRKRVP